MRRLTDDATVYHPFTVGPLREARQSRHPCSGGLPISQLSSYVLDIQGESALPVVLLLRRTLNRLYSGGFQWFVKAIITRKKVSTAHPPTVHREPATSPVRPSTQRGILLGLCPVLAWSPPSPRSLSSFSESSRAAPARKRRPRRRRRRLRRRHPLRWPGAC